MEKEISMKKESKRFIIISALSGALAVALGAFGAHALQGMLIESGRVDTYETAVLYHFVHTLTLLSVGILIEHRHHVWLTRAAWSFTFGLLLFSGSLYVLCFTGMTWLGAVTPFGGVLFIMGWLFLVLGVLKRK